LQCLEEIRNSKKLRDLTVAIYSTSSSEENIEETFVKGANVYIKKPAEFNTLKKVLAEVMATNWQFHTSNLNKETFILSL
jgi:CheY-like chemotaxis protein